MYLSLFIYSFTCVVRGVPYIMTIGAVNEVGQGENVSVIAFTATNSEFIKVSYTTCHLNLCHLCSYFQSPI